MCKKQTSVSHSSTESEIISLDTGLRQDGLPALDLWDLIVSVFGNISHVSDRTGQPRQKNRLEKLSPRWEYGVFAGVKVLSGEVWVATKGGLQTVRSVRRIPVEEWWNENNKDFVKHVPWNKSGEGPEADGDLPGAPEGVAAAAGSVDPLRVIVVNTREVAHRDFYIKKRDVEAYGHTKDCLGCRTMFQGGTRQAHTTECRERFRNLMKDEDKVVKTLEKRKGYEEKMEEEEESRSMEMKKQRREGKKAEKRGQKREADADAIEEGSAKREEKAKEVKPRG